MQSEASGWGPSVEIAHVGSCGARPAVVGSYPGECMTVHAVPLLGNAARVGEPSACRDDIQDFPATATQTGAPNRT